MGLITENEFKGQFWDTVAHGKENWSAFIDFLLESRMAGDFETFANSL